MPISPRIHTMQANELQTLLRRWQLPNSTWKCQQHLVSGTVSEYFVEHPRKVKLSTSIAGRYSKNSKHPEICIVKSIVKHNKLLPIQLFLRDITKFADLLRNEPQYQHHFVRLLSISFNSTNVFCALEHMKLGSLERYIDFPWLESDVRMVAEGVLSGLQFMHHHQFMHLDLKPSVIFLTVTHHGRLAVKLSDFGVYKRVRFNDNLMPEIRQEDRGLQDTTYMAPETFEFDGQNSEIFTPTADCWSLACIIYRLLMVEAPFRSPRDIITFTEMGTNLKEKLLQRGIDDIGISFISQLLKRDPRNRLAASAALQHSWIRVPPEQPSEALMQRVCGTGPNPSNLSFPSEKGNHNSRSNASPLRIISSILKWFFCHRT